tara:strand:+ start:5149 stop:5652 length:504 start_codon:yes stop_codon:yes gene_type:complete
MEFLINLKERVKVFFIKENIYFYIFVIFIFFLDRFAKLKIVNNFNESTYYVNDFVNLNLIWNIGVGFGLLSTDSVLMYNLTTLLIGLVIIILIYLFTKSKKIEKFIYSIIIGGALGNFYDRLIYKAVPDFIDLHYNNFHWFTFNVADIFITIGIILLLFKELLIKNV